MTLPRRCVAIALVGALSGVAQAQDRLGDGLAALEAGDRDAAAALFAEAIEADPDDDAARALLNLAEADDDDERADALDRALRLVPDRPELQALHLGDLQREIGEERVLSFSDSRRISAARRLVALDPASAQGHQELALYALLDYQWRRRNAERRRLWNPEQTNYATRAALRARDAAHTHLDAVTEAEPRRADAHRLRMRIAAFDRDAAALLRAADAARRATPYAPEVSLYRALALARLGRDAEADAACRVGVDGLPSAERAVFLDAGRFVRPTEAADYAADSVAWAERFWQTQDDRLLTPVNERWVEHCARLVEADLLYRHEDVRGWDTARGDTHVRYGRPLRDTWWLQPRDGRYHRWEYADFTVTFHDWVSSGDYQPASSAEGEDDATRLRNRNNTVGQEGRAASALPLPVAATAFRGPLGVPEWVVAYRAEAGPTRDGLRGGVFVVDSLGRTVASRRQRDADLVAYRGGWTGAVTVPASGGHVVVEADRAGSLAFGRGQVALPSRTFTGSGLQLSDLLIAYRVDIDGEGPLPPGHVRRGEIVLHPAPDEPYTTADPLVVYVEAYGLGLDDGSSRFDVEAALQPVDDAGRLRRLSRRLLGRRPPPSVSVATEQRGDRADDAVVLTLDLQNQPPGDYRLSLTLRDRVADASASVSRTVRLDSP